VIETSPGNYQAWLHHGTQLPRDVSTHAARQLAARFEGDVKAADWRHFGRLAGFTNRKPQHERNGQQPYCRLIEATGKRYANAPEFVANSRQQVQRLNEDRFNQARVYQAYRPGQKATRTIDSFRADPQYDNDLHRADLAYALYARARGLPADEIKAAIASRDLSKKGGPLQQDKYIESTLRKAASLGRGL